MNCILQIARACAEEPDYYQDVTAAFAGQGT